ncbi:uncharacterized protein LOC134462643 [Engraulis encrasicolus]|uniref:uncharacterized protein LOC134462643 n=1 Tax=Engraulis encrasicolus TaxID=184585 RepID=UPI002FD004E7
MASAQASTDLSKISEGMSLSDLDVCFCLPQSSSVSALESSANTIQFPKDILVDFSNLSHSTLNLEWLPTSPIVLSPTVEPQQCSSFPQTHTLGLPISLAGKSTSVAAPLQKVLKTPVLTSSPNLSGLDLSANNAPWELSQIRPLLETSRVQLEWTELDLTASPRNKSAATAMAEISSLVCTATSPQPAATSQSDGQRSWKETLPLGSGQEGTQSLD